MGCSEAYTAKITDGKLVATTSAVVFTLFAAAIAAMSGRPSVVRTTGSFITLPCPTVNERTASSCTLTYLKESKYIGRDPIRENGDGETGS